MGEGLVERKSWRLPRSHRGSSKMRDSRNMKEGLGRSPWWGPSQENSDFPLFRWPSLTPSQPEKSWISRVDILSSQHIVRQFSQGGGGGWQKACCGRYMEDIPKDRIISKETMERNSN
jgi:hypothetical protein